MKAERIHRLIQSGQYVYSRHAERERQADAIPDSVRSVPAAGAMDG